MLKLSRISIILIFRPSASRESLASIMTTEAPFLSCGNSASNINNVEHNEALYFISFHKARKKPRRNLIWQWMRRRTQNGWLFALKLFSFKIDLLVLLPIVGIDNDGERISPSVLKEERKRKKKRHKWRSFRALLFHPPRGGNVSLRKEASSTEKESLNETYYVTTSH